MVHSIIMGTGEQKLWIGLCTSLQSRQQTEGSWRHLHFYPIFYPPPTCGTCPLPVGVSGVQSMCSSSMMPFFFFQKFPPRHTSLKPPVFLVPIKLTMKINHCANQVRVLSKTPWLNTLLPRPAILGLWWFLLTSYKSFSKSFLPAP